MLRKNQKASLAGTELRSVEDATDLHQEARDWEADNTETLEKSARLGWRVALCLGVLLALSIAGMTGMGIEHAKPIVPPVMFIDTNTGNIQTLDVFHTKVVTENEYIVKAAAWQYVRSREEYLYEMLQTDYDTVKAMSDLPVFAEYDKRFQGDMPLDKRLGRNIVWRIERSSIQIPPDQPNTVIVHFKKTVKHLDTNTEDPPEYDMARLTYAVVPVSKGQKETAAIDNPHGWRTKSYVVDNEMAPAKVPASPSLQSIKSPN